MNYDPTKIAEVKKLRERTGCDLHAAIDAIDVHTTADAAMAAQSMYHNIIGFDEQALLRDVIRVWGYDGAHARLLRQLIKDAK